MSGVKDSQSARPTLLPSVALSRSPKGLRHRPWPLRSEFQVCQANILIRRLIRRL